MPRSELSNHWIFEKNSLFLRERKELVNQSWALNSKDSKEGLTRLTPALTKESWSIEQVLKDFLLSPKHSNWGKIWDKSFFSSPSYFYSSSLKKIEEEIEHSLLTYSKLDTYLERYKSTKKYEDSWQEQYKKLLNPLELKQEALSNRKKQEEENLITELDNLELTRKYEELSAKTWEKIEELKSTVLEFDTTFHNALRGISSEFKIPLDRCLPSMFLAFFHSEDFSKTSSVPLKDTPKWVKKFTSLTKRWSISRYIPEERTKALFSPLDPKTLTKQNIQWQDPEEKWFYYYKPLITLFFDKYRERYKKTLITTWEEPEYTFPLTEVDITELVSGSKDRPIYGCEGLTPWKIGEELELIEATIDSYAQQFAEDAKREFAEKGFSQLPVSELFSSTELLNQIDKEF
ncbi:hypothetical protein WEN_00965 [Mycoplasma wenyonii str. Massachusetts]|uniref:Uncharacterized protein n=1 Tax=Mycoplasma wenyonii (strain Massachusetts) TaxID=1197325 RepID=I6YL59_MYCWM|nr:hypothetical protein [Mycoplasma wenyonii]AFN64994.1 hypothetical protein WEN_00965 [Mycoplasma wenyonii str. Massachusetts]